MDSIHMTRFHRLWDGLDHSGALLCEYGSEEQRQFEMDFTGPEHSDDVAKERGDEQVRIAIDGLGDLESAMKERL